MFSRKLTYKKIPLLLFLLAVVFFVMSMTGSNTGDDTNNAAAKTEKRVIQRIDILESHVRQVAERASDTKFLMQIPEDMVIYRYVNDSLTSWINQFPIINDDISTRMLIQRLPMMTGKDRLHMCLARRMQCCCSSGRPRCMP